MDNFDDRLMSLLWNFAEAIRPEIGPEPKDEPKHVRGSSHAAFELRLGVYNACRAIVSEVACHRPQVDD